MLSRVAERLYWMARYIERAENSARLLNVYHMLMLDLPSGSGLAWPNLVDIVGGHEDFHSRYRSAGERNIAKWLLADAENPGSIISSLTGARENARTTRDLVPSEGFEIINELLMFVRRRLKSTKANKDRYEFLSQIVQRCQTVTGLLAGTMSQGAAYQFVRVGRNLERADMTTRILDVGSATLSVPKAERVLVEHRLWTWLLKAMSAHQMYRQTARRQVTGTVAANFLLHDVQFPRSVLHSLGEIRACLRTLPRSTAANRAVGRAYRLVQSGDANDMLHDGFHQFIDDMQVELGEIHRRIEKAWFDPES